MIATSDYFKKPVSRDATDYTYSNYYDDYVDSSCTWGYDFTNYYITEEYFLIPPVIRYAVVWLLAVYLKILSYLVEKRCRDPDHCIPTKTVLLLTNARSLSFPLFPFFLDGGRYHFIKAGNFRFTGERKERPNLPMYYPPDFA